MIFLIFCILYGLEWSSHSSVSFMFESVSVPNSMSNIGLAVLSGTGFSKTIV